MFRYQGQWVRVLSDSRDGDYCVVEISGGSRERVLVAVLLEETREYEKDAGDHGRV